MAKTAIKASKKRIQEPFGDKVFNIVNNIFLALAFLMVAYPLIYVLSASFSDSNAVASGRVWLWPVGLNVEAYKAIFQEDSIMTGYMNSIIYTVFGTLFNLVLTTLTAYPLARTKLFGKKIITWFFMFTMFFSGGLIPLYLQVRNLHLLNTRMSIIILGGISIYNMIVMRSFMTSSIPEDLYEAAELDGCSDIGILFRIVIPLSKPILAVMTLYYAVGHWNDFFTPLIYTSNPEFKPLQLVLRELLIQNKVDAHMGTQSMQSVINRMGMYELLRYAVIVVASVPVLCIYPFVQKHFVKGVMIGSIKG